MSALLLSIETLKSAYLPPKTVALFSGRRSKHPKSPSFNLPNPLAQISLDGQTYSAQLGSGETVGVREDREDIHPVAQAANLADQHVRQR